MRARSVVFLILGLFLLLAGSLFWRSRFTYSPETVLNQKLGTRLAEVPPETTLDLSDACRTAAEENGWVIFVLNTSITNDREIRTFFETAEEPLGLYVEYEPGLFRLGLGMGPGNVNEAGESVSNLELSIRRVHRAESSQVFIGVSKDTTRVVTNSRDARIAWPGYLADEWKCNAVRIADESRKSTHGYTCEGCNVRLRYASGDDKAELTEVLDSLSNVRQFNVRRWSGTALILLGLGTIALSRREFTCRRRQSNRQGRISQF